MQQFSIAVIVGSLRKDSINRKLANALARLAPADMLLEQLKIGGRTPRASVPRHRR